MKIKNYKISPESGFTLLELIVSTAIFSTLITVLSGFFLYSLNMQRRAFNSQQVVENANFILDTMAKEFRTARITTPDTAADCDPPSDTLEFTNPDGQTIDYSLNLGNVIRTIDGVASVVNSNQVEFSRLQFCILGNVLGDNTQPRVTVSASIRTRASGQQETINVQTTLSQRYLSN